MVAAVFCAGLWLGACSSSAPSTEATPQKARSSNVESEPSALPLQSSTLPTGVARCHTAQLEIGFLRVTGAAGHAVGDFELRNTSSSRCFVKGYVGMQMLGPGGSPLETHLIRDPVSLISALTLAPGSPALGVASPDHAHFQFLWVSNCDVTGTVFTPEEPTSLQITPPDETTSVFISSRAADASSMMVCPGQEPPGTVHTKPIDRP